MEKIVEKKRRFGDRYDGYRIRNLDPMFTLIPYIMRTRTDSQVMFDEKIDITELEAFVARERKGDFPGLTLSQVIIAALIRTVAKKPRINRFVIGGNLFARNYLKISLTVKQSMSENSDESIIMPYFQLTDTLKDVMKKYSEELEKVISAEQKPKGNDTDLTIKILSNLPGFIKFIIVSSMRNLDKRGWMPKIINEVSPFHASMFVTNVGSIGIGSVYHHLYEFGTTSVFVAIGKKETVKFLDKDHNLTERKYINLRFVVDERICDGYYYASSLKALKSYLKNPEVLKAPPEQVFYDV